jgi:5'-3' exonuclease, N-terminal resolvase-like domain|nr:MAG TPA: 5'-3' exonuclease [Caudoviricetes sp.]
MKDLFVVDGTYFLRRSFFVKDKGFVEVENEITGEIEKVQDKRVVVIAFFQALLKKIRETNYKPEIVVAWDKGSWKYRPKDKFKEYKADRQYDETFQCCWDANDLAIEILNELGIKSIQVPGLEADDLGMFFAYNAKNVTLYTKDGDWKQALNPNTVLDNTKQIITWQEVVGDQIKTPLDLAIKKAIDSEGHDNLAKVLVDDEYLVNAKGENKLHRIIHAYKKRQLPQTILDAIDRNYILARMDNVLYDQKTINEIMEQYNKPKPKLNNLGIITVLNKLGDYPAYFNGVIAKYLSLH